MVMGAESQGYQAGLDFARGNLGKRSLAGVGGGSRGKEAGPGAERRGPEGKRWVTLAGKRDRAKGIMTPIIIMVPELLADVT